MFSTLTQKITGRTSGGDETENCVSEVCAKADTLSTIRGAALSPGASVKAAEIDLVRIHKDMENHHNVLLEQMRRLEMRLNQIACANPAASAPLMYPTLPSANSDSARRLPVVSQYGTRNLL